MKKLLTTDNARTTHAGSRVITIAHLESSGELKYLPFQNRRTYNLQTLQVELRTQSIYIIFFSLSNNDAALTLSVYDKFNFGSLCRENAYGDL